MVAATRATAPIARDALLGDLLSGPSPSFASGGLPPHLLRGYTDGATAMAARIAFDFVVALRALRTTIRVHIDTLQPRSGAPGRITPVSSS